MTQYNVKIVLFNESLMKYAIVLLNIVMMILLIFKLG